MTLEHACQTYSEQCMQMQAARRESVESCQKVRGLEEQLAELRQRLNLSTQAEAAARLDTSKARPLQATVCVIGPGMLAVFNCLALPLLAIDNKHEVKRPVLAL